MATLGSMAVVPDGFEVATANRAVGILIPKNAELDSHYLVALFNSPIGLRLIELSKRGGIQQRINLEDMANLKIPVPPIDIQEKIVSMYLQGIRDKKAKEAEAREKLASVDGLVLDALGITLPEREADTLDKRIFFTKSSDISNGRFDPDALHPERINAVKAVQSSKYPVEYLHTAVKFSRILTTENIPNSRYVGLENIQSNTGIFVPKAEVEEFGTANVFKKGQVLFPKLRPYLNKVFHAPFDGVCSTEFYVLDGVHVSNDFLSCFLRTSVIVSQTKRLMTGNTLPRLQTKDVESLQIPIPPLEVQAEIAERVEAIYSDAKRLREESVEILKNAKAEVERMILGG